MEIYQGQNSLPLARLLVHSTPAGRREQSDPLRNWLFGRISRAASYPASAVRSRTAGYVILPHPGLAHWRDWLAAGTELSRQIRERRGGEYLAVDDGFYLALAQGLGCEFWTVDRHLHAAAIAAWIRLPDAAD